MTCSGETRARRDVALLRRWSAVGRASLPNRRYLLALPAMRVAFPHALIVSVALLGACSPPPQSSAEPEVIEAEDIGGGPTAAMTPEGDAVAAPSAAANELAGVLPGGVPRDLPIYRPSSVVDFEGGESAEVPGRVTLDSPDSAPTVSAWLQAQLDASGWTDAGDPWVRQKGNRTVHITVRGQGSGSRIEIAF